jgi:sarcosine oxidase gamma subunit
MIELLGTTPAARLIWLMPGGCWLTYRTGKVPMTEVTWLAPDSWLVTEE